MAIDRAIRCDNSTTESVYDARQQSITQSNNRLTPAIDSGGAIIPQCPIFVHHVGIKTLILRLLETETLILRYMTLQLRLLRLHHAEIE